MISIIRVVLFSILFTSANVWASPILVYRDKGTCVENCAEAIGDLATQHFGSVKYLKQSNSNSPCCPATRYRASSNVRA